MNEVIQRGGAEEAAGTQDPGYGQRADRMDTGNEKRICQYDRIEQTENSTHAGGV